MKLIEDQRITIISPLFSKGKEEEFTLYGVEEVHNYPPALKLLFKKNERPIYGFLKGKKRDIGIDTHLRGYKKELEEKLRGNTWSQILKHDFKFLCAGRLDGS